MLVFAVVSISLALILYTVGVWAERFKKTLLPWHVVIFWLGLVFDTMGTLAMGNLGEAGFSLSLHGISGMVAIVLMLVHAIWASVVLHGNKPGAKDTFHRLSVVVWLIWLIPYVTGAMAGMST